MKPKLITILVLIAMLVFSGVVMAASVVPVHIDTPVNVPCSNLVEGSTELKFEEETLFDGSSWDGITISNFGYNAESEPVSFDWNSTSILVLAVIVKDGIDGSNFYDYRPDGSYGDTYLTTPFNGAKAISHISFCYIPGEDVESLTVSKTVVTSFTREHFWDIDKKVETENGEFINDTPKIWLYIDGSGDETATWTVDVTYDRYEDSGWNVSGVITIENTGQLDAVITPVGDVLGGTPINVLCGVSFPYTLLVDATLTCSYSEDGYVEGNNVVTVTTERDSYSATEPIVWGAPTTEINKTVTISDLSDLFGTPELGTVTAPTGDTFTYTMNFAWADYGQDLCGDYIYDNTATIVETGQYADATLLVNVQCYIYETAYAKGADAICFIPTFKNWGWTNPITPNGTYTWDLWAGAAQCDTTKGTLVGSVTVDYVNGGVKVTYNVFSNYILDETHVYAGYTMFPKDRRGNDTVAPGQYTNATSPWSDKQGYVIAHAVVGMPDPNFGP